MEMAWGYSPKIEKYIPLGEFPADRYLVIAAQAIANLGWKMSHVSASGVIAYTPISLQSYSEELSVRIVNGFAIVKSECVGIQMLFNDYGKNALNLEKFFHEFEYVEFHLKEKWDESLAQFHAFAATQDPDYFEKAPLRAKDKIKNILYLFVPQRYYMVTPILILLNILFFIGKIIFSIFFFAPFVVDKQGHMEFQNIYFYLGGNNRELVLNGQYWRLISYQFVHTSFLHLFSNLYALTYIGLMVEHQLGTKKYLTVYLLSGICGGILSMLFHLDIYMIGASGAIMGLFGAFIALLISGAFEKNATRALLISTVTVTLLMLVNGLRGRTDNAAHLGGLVSGFLLTYILFNQKLLRFKLALHVRYAAAFVLVFLFAGLTLVLAPNYQNKAFKQLETAYQQNISKFMKIYRISNQQAKEEQLRLLTENGIKSWTTNEQIVKKMDRLVLNKNQRKRVIFHRQMVDKHLQLVKLFYKQTVEENPMKYKAEIALLFDDINRIRLAVDQKLLWRF